VLSYTVAQRSRELAVRTALGARRIDVVRLVFGQTMKVTAAGITAGLLASLVLTRSISALLHGVTPHDGATYVVVPLVLFVVAAAACLPPAIRAAKLDPLRALTCLKQEGRRSGAVFVDTPDLLISCETFLLVAERQDRINATGAVRGDQAGGRRD